MVMRMAAESSFTLSISLLLLLEIHINTDELLLLTLQCYCNFVDFQVRIYFDIRKVIEETSQTVVKTCQPSASVGR